MAITLDDKTIDAGAPKAAKGDLDLYTGEYHFVDVAEYNDDAIRLLNAGGSESKMVATLMKLLALNGFNEGRVHGQNASVEKNIIKLVGVQLRDTYNRKRVWVFALASGGITTVFGFAGLAGGQVGPFLGKWNMFKGLVGSYDFTKADDLKKWSSNIMKFGQGPAGIASAVQNIFKESAEGQRSLFQSEKETDTRNLQNFDAAKQRRNDFVDKASQQLSQMADAEADAKKRMLS